MQRTRRAALVALPLLLAAWVGLDYRRARAARVGLLGAHVERVAATGEPEIDRRIRSETDAEVAALLIARSTLALELDPVWRLQTSSDADRRDSVERLQSARELALEALRRRPTSWQAAMILGATTYLIRYHERDTRLFTRAREWEGPLETAHRLAPGQIEPRRFLAAAYVDTWPTLSPAKRQVAEGLLLDVLADRDSFRLLIAPWLTVAGIERGLEFVPREPWAWSHLQTSLAATRDWEHYAVARDRWHESLRIALEAGQAEARARLAGGDVEGANATLHSLLAQTPVGKEYAELFSSALVQLPPGPMTVTAERQLRAWLDWALRLCTFDECPLPPSIMGRLEGSVRDSLPFESALAALAANDRERAAAIESRHRIEGEEPWADYLLFKASWMLQHGDPPAASAALRSVHREHRDSALYFSIAQRLAEIDRTSVGEAPAGTRAWDSKSWRKGRTDLYLEILPETSAQGLELDVTTGPGGGAIEVRWNGERLGTYAAATGQPILVEVAVPPELHLVEIAPVAGARPQYVDAKLLTP